ncbi:MAG: glycoside hydrolase family 13 protein [Eubacteriaceae bacterium]
MSIDFFHNSWCKEHRSPFGAQPIGGKVQLRAESKDAYTVRLRTYVDNEETYYPMTKSGDSHFWEITLDLPKTPKILWYSFAFESHGKSYTYGTQSDDLGGEGQVYSSHPPSYQITVYDPKRHSPEWYTQGIMYQIFPDRFHRGSDFSIDSFGDHAVLHPNWNAPPHYFKNEKGGIEYWDFFGGTLEGIREKLDYLKSLNVTILYLNPIFKSQSNHRYDTGDYMTIDPILGTQESFEALIADCKARGIHLILDGVFSHTGDDSLYFNRFGNYPGVGAFQSTASPYYPWYDFVDFPNHYTCWWGVDSMPNTDELYSGFQDYIYKNQDSVIKHWTRLGVSGWRLDVADELPGPFIRGLKKSLLEEKESSILIGEVWEDASRKIAYDELRTYFSGNELDAVMNYPFREAFIDFVLGQKTSKYTNRLMMSLYDHYPKNQFMGNMNLIGSHDRRRILTVLGEAHEYLKDKDRENYTLPESNLNLGKKRLKLISLIQMTFPGVPCVYYGDEVGVQGFEDPHNRRTYPWGNEDHELLEWYQKITTLRSESPPLLKGDWVPLDSVDDLLAFERHWEDETLLCLFNRNPQAIHLFKDTHYINRTGVDLLTNAEVSLDTVVIEPLSYAVIHVNTSPKKLIL